MRIKKKKEQKKHKKDKKGPIKVKDFADLLEIVQNEVYNKIDDLEGTGTSQVVVDSAGGINRTKTIFNNSAKDLVYAFELDMETGDGTKKGEFGDLDGLKEGNKMTFSLTYQAPDLEAVQKAYNASFAKVCAKTPANIRALSNALDHCLLAKQKEGKLMQVEDATKYAHNLCAPIKKILVALLKGECKQTKENQIATSKTFKEAYTGAALVYKFSASYNPNRFNYRDPATLVAENYQGANSSFNFSVGLITESYSKHEFSLRSQEGYASGTPFNLCSPWPPKQRIYIVEM